VVVSKLDRLFRSVADAANVIADFDKKVIQLVAIAEGFDVTNPFGRAMAQMASGWDVGMIGGQAASGEVVRGTTTGAPCFCGCRSTRSCSCCWGTTTGWGG
jgi:hypothetical protein